MTIDHDRQSAVSERPRSPSLPPQPLSPSLHNPRKKTYRALVLRTWRAAVCRHEKASRDKRHLREGKGEGSIEMKCTTRHSSRLIGRPLPGGGQRKPHEVRFLPALSAKLARSLSPPQKAIIINLLQLVSAEAPFAMQYCWRAQVALCTKRYRSFFTSAPVI